MADHRKRAKSTLKEKKISQNMSSLNKVTEQVTNNDYKKRTLKAALNKDRQLPENSFFYSQRKS